MKKSILSTLAVIFSYTTFAQSKCGVVFQDSLNQTINQKWLQQKSNFEYQVQQYTSALKASRTTAYQTIRIPVVVHVIHNTASKIIGGTNNINISDEQILSQIQTLNEDYRKKEGTAGYNTNPVGADMQIEFFLADSTATGETTKGITRHYTTKTGFDIIKELGAITAFSKWNPYKYLNIYVVKSGTTSTPLTIGYSGFPFDAYLPGLIPNTSEAAEQQIFDGVVIDYRYFGRCCGTISTTYNMGRTTTHEVGHWLGLLHPTGDVRCGTDYCDDTPTIESLNNGFTCNKMTSTCDGNTVTNQIENYMDYSPDVCMSLFTNDQKIRTRAALELSYRRKSLVNNSTVVSESNALQVSIDPNPVKSSANIKVQFSGTENITIQLISENGNTLNEYNYQNVTSNYFLMNTSSYANGMYFLRVNTSKETKVVRMFVLK
ncbi:M43 family zinc metalloprotease [Flectobacillus roseus]